MQTFRQIQESLMDDAIKMHSFIAEIALERKQKQRLFEKLGDISANLIKINQTEGTEIYKLVAFDPDGTEAYVEYFGDIEKAKKFAQYHDNVLSDDVGVGMRELRWKIAPDKKGVFSQIDGDLTYAIITINVR